MATATLIKTELSEAQRNKPVLDARFRCDKCGSQAYVRTTLKTGLPLYWCGHHAKEYEAALTPIISSWYSEEVRLKEDRKKGSEN
jgi:transcription elongation factor Elf1